MPAQFIRSLASKHRNDTADARLGIMLAFIAGAINAGGFLAVGYYTSHMTGIVSSVADYIALHEAGAAVAAMGYLFSFITGATLTSVLVNWARARNMHSEYALSLMLESFLLLIFGVFAAARGTDAVPVHAVVGLLCFIMGLQNALITKVSHTVIRTTHVTGLATDIGIGLGRMIHAYRSGNGDLLPPPGRLHLHASLLLAFLCGGIAGAFSFKSIGFSATIPLALVLAVSSALPVLDDLRERAGRK